MKRMYKSIVAALVIVGIALFIPAMAVAQDAEPAEPTATGSDSSEPSEDQPSVDEALPDADETATAEPAAPEPEPAAAAPTAPAPTAPAPAAAAPAPAQVAPAATRGFINNIFFTGQFGGGPMASLGAGIAFLDNIVRPEVLFGYTVSDGFSGFSLNAKLNARILALPINDWFGMYATIGTSFVFFSSDAQIVSAAFVAQELEFRNILDVPAMALYFEQNFFFVETIEGNTLFQLAIGLRASLF